MKHVPASFKEDFNVNYLKLKQVHDKKKILLITTSFGWGGTEGHVSNLAVYYKKRNINVFVLFDEIPIDRKSILDEAGIPYFLLKDEHNFTSKVYENILFDFLNLNQPDIVHLNVWKRRSNIMKVLYKLDIPFVETLHCTFPNKSFFWNLRNRFCFNKSPIETLKLNLIQKKANPLIINISDKSMRNFNLLYPYVKKTKRIYCGAYFPYHIAENFDQTEQNVLWIGSMIERKRPLFAIDVWEKLHTSYPDAKLTMIGVGPLFEVVRERTARNSNNISVLGSVPDLYPYLKNGYIMLCTSTDEGIPKNIIYAMNFGIPIVSTDVGAIGEVLTDGEQGFLTEVNDIDMFSSRLEQLLGDRIIHSRMGEKARVQGEKLFLVEKMIDDILKSYVEYLDINLEPEPFRNTEKVPTLD